MSGVNGKVKGMVDAVTGLQTGSVVEAWKRVVELSDGFGSSGRPSAGPLSNVLMMLQGYGMRCLTTDGGSSMDSENYQW